MAEDTSADEKKRPHLDCGFMNKLVAQIVTKMLLCMVNN